MNKKTLNILKKSIFFIGSILIIIILAINWKSIKGEWIGFWGSIIGSILGGIVTLLALRKTIKSETIARNEDRRFQVIPYLKYNVTPDKPNSKLWRNIYVEPNHKIVEEVIKANTTYKHDLSFYIDIENVGMNSAVNLSILRIEYCGITNYSYIDYKIMKVGEKIHLAFDVLINFGGKLSINEEDTGIEPIKIKLAYTDLLENYYEQDIEIGCSWGCSVVEEGDKVIKKEYFYNVSQGIEDISSPIYMNEKNIISERDNKMKKFRVGNKHKKKFFYNKKS